MAFTTSSSTAQSSEINVTPLIDILLVLLIIFMVISPIAPRGLDSSIPQGKAATGATLPPVVVRLLAADTGRPVRYEIAKEEIAYEALPIRLSAMFAVRSDRTTFIEADRNLSYREVVNVVSEARQAGAGAIVLSGLH